MNNKPKQRCKLCNKALVAIGRSRKNGKNHKDWTTRKYHKKCWIEGNNTYKICYCKSCGKRVEIPLIQKFKCQCKENFFICT